MRDQSIYKYARDEWRKNNPDYAKTYYESIKNTPEFKEKARIRAKKWRDNNKEKASKSTIQYRKNRLLNDPFFKFCEVTRSLIKKSFSRNGKSFKKQTKSVEILGCSLEFFREYILSKCPKGVELKDFKMKGYHIDHIIPISSATTEEEVIKLCHYTNLQPLWWKDNLSKSNKLINL